MQIKKFNKGSALLTVLMSITILTFCAICIYNIVFSEYNYNSNRARLVRARWTARAALNSVLHRIQSLEIAINDNKIQDSFDDSFNYEVHIKKLDEGKFRLVSKGIERNIVQEISREYTFMKYSDFTLFLNKKLVKNIQNEPAYFSGKTFVNNGIEFFIKKKEEKIKISIPERIDLPFLYYINSMMLNGEEINDRSEFELNFMRNENIVRRNPYQFEDLKGKYLKVEIEKINTISLNSLYNLFRERDEAIYINKYDNYKTMEIINEKLNVKHFINMGNSRSSAFRAYTYNNIKNIYFKKLGDIMPVEMILNPYDTIDTMGIEKNFIFKNKEIILNSDDQKVKIEIEGNISDLNKFSYASATKIYASIDRNIKDVYLKDKKLYDGNQIMINRKERTISFFNPSFTKLLNKGNGRRTKFDYNINIKNPVIFTGRERNTGFKIENNKIIFDVAPGYNQPIWYYKYLPEIYVTKGYPAYGVGIFTDKRVKCVYLNISKFGRDVLFVSDLPVLVEGNISADITILSLNDIYLRNISSKVSRRSLKVYGRIVWLDMQNRDTFKAANIYIYTEADGIYCVNDGYKEKAKKTIIGSITANCIYTPIRYGKDIDEHQLIFSSEDLFSINIIEKKDINNANIPILIKE